MLPNPILRFFALAGVGLALVVPSRATVLTLGGSTRSRDSVVARADTIVKAFGQAAAQLTLASRTRRAQAGKYDARIPFSLPTVVRLSGATNGGTVHHLLGGDLVLQFDSSGANAFPTAYQQLLQSVFDSAKSTLDLVFGLPSVGGNVHVANFDATIGDRDAIAGGYYLPDNGSGVPEIRFPVYNSNEAAAVNFVHCLLLAYLGPNGYASDAFEEGLVRAVTAKVARTASALPSTLDPTVIETTLQNSYDIEGDYDWCNQRPLGGPMFIAANLRSLPLPISGGSGPYLLRYLMAGSAWSKVLVEYPTFAASLNAQVYATPALGSNVPGLEAAAQTILTNQRPTSATVEGLPFLSWFQRQCILDTTLTFGSKVLVQTAPLTTGLVAGDFGVFSIELTYFSTDSSGNETLLSGTSYPIFWDNTFNRIVTSAQDEKIQITASDGAVVPNFPDLYAGQPYRATVDVPVGDLNQRVFLPSGAIATATGSTINDCYGTVSGVAALSTDVVRVDVYTANTLIGTAPVTNNAFGISLGTTGGFNTSTAVTFNVVRTRGGTDTVVMTRQVNKSIGSLGIDLRAGGDGTFTFTNGLPAGVSMVGLPADPYSSDQATIFGVPASSLLLGRYDSALSSYDLYPTIPALTLGNAYFVRLATAQPSFALTGRFSPGVATTVALKPGWNMVSAPVKEPIQTASVLVVHAADFPTDFVTGQGATIGTDFFKFVPGSPDPTTGVPEGGTFVPATEFDPGVGYFFRVLAAEGVSLLFEPDQALLLGIKSAPPLGWQLRVHAITGGRESVSLFGQAPGGGSFFNPAVDSGLPPAIGTGLQVYSMKGEHLYRDVRQPGTRQVYTLRIDGLTPGKSTLVQFERVSGRMRLFNVVDPSTGKSRTMFPGASMILNPKSTSASLLVTVAN